MRERQRAEIVRTLLAERGFLSIADLMAATGASAASARSEAGRLAEARFAERVHDGPQALKAAFAPTQAPWARDLRSFDNSFAINLPAERAIARRAVDICEDGDVVIINGGASTYQISENGRSFARPSPTSSWRAKRSNPPRGWMASLRWP
jgi:DeoR family ulaG and ulaABCDEF operon transcriptional repressor